MEPRCNFLARRQLSDIPLAELLNCGVFEM